MIDSVTVYIGRLVCARAGRGSMNTMKTDNGFKIAQCLAGKLVALLRGLIRNMLGEKTKRYYAYVTNDTSAKTIMMTSKTKIIDNVQAEKASR